MKTNNYRKLDQAFLKIVTLRHAKILTIND